MRTIQIFSPIWNGGQRKVGIAEYKMTEDMLKIEILYKTKTRGRIYPEPFFISRNQAMTYPTQVVRGGVKLRLIPIGDLQAIKTGAAVG